MQRLDFLTRYLVRGVTVVGSEPEPAPSPWRSLYVWDRFPDRYQPLSPLAKLDTATGQPVQPVERMLPPLYLAQVIIASNQGRIVVQGTQAAPGKLAARGYVDPYQVLRRTQGPYGNLVSGQVEFVP